MSDSTSEKQALRLQAQSTREFISRDFQGYQDFILMHLENWPVFAKAPQVLLYHAFRNEVDLLPLCEKYPDKQWYLPRAKGKNLEFHLYMPGDILEAHKYGMQEPLASAPALEEIQPGALALLPALMADRSGYRLGYGQGFYDRFLAENEGKLHTAVIVPGMLLMPMLPRDSWDKPADAVISDTGVIEIPRFRI